MIEVFDEINNRYKSIPDNTKIVKHTLNKQITYLEEVKLEEKQIIGIIFKLDGSTMILYKNIHANDKQGLYT